MTARRAAGAVLGLLATGLLPVTLARLTAQDVIVPTGDWTTNPPMDGATWEVDLPSGKTPLTLHQARSCPGQTSFELRGPDGSAVWGRLFITSRGMGAFIEDDDNRRVWFLRPQPDSKAGLRLNEATGTPAPAGRFRCAMSDRTPDYLPRSSKLLSGADAEQAWPGVQQQFTLALSMTPQVRMLVPDIEQQLLQTADFASAVFERYTGMSFCSQLTGSDLNLDEVKDVERRREKVQASFSKWKKHDIGVLFAHNIGSEATRGSACDPSTSGGTIVDFNVDVWDTWNLAHELAHQFGATHTFEGTTPDRVPASATEPLFGRSELAYPDSFQGLWFHPLTVAQLLDGRAAIVDHYNKKCGGAVSTNTVGPPKVQSLEITIPSSTPFHLFAQVTPAIGPRGLIAIDDGTIDTNNGPPGPPYYRSDAATANPVRSFPSDSVLLGSAPLPADEGLMAAGDARMMLMAHTPNGTAIATARVHVAPGSQPFAVAAPAGWQAGRTNAIAWDSNLLAQSPFNVSSVNIFILDGNDWTLALSNAPNSGTANICVLASEAGPNVRVRIEPQTVAFYATSPAFNVAPASGAAACTR